MTLPADVTRALVANLATSRVNRHASPADMVTAAVRAVADTIATIQQGHAGIIEGEPELLDAREQLRHLGDALYVLAERASEARIDAGDPGDPWAETAAKDGPIDRDAA